MGSCESCLGNGKERKASKPPNTEASGSAGAKPMPVADDSFSNPPTEPNVVMGPMRWANAPTYFQPINGPPNPMIMFQCPLPPQNVAQHPMPVYIQSAVSSMDRTPSASKRKSHSMGSSAHSQSTPESVPSVAESVQINQDCYQTPPLPEDAVDDALDNPLPALLQHRASTHRVKHIVAASQGVTDIKEMQMIIGSNYKSASIGVDDTGLPVEPLSESVRRHIRRESEIESLKLERKQMKVHLKAIGGFVSPEVSLVSNVSESDLPQDFEDDLSDISSNHEHSGNSEHLSGSRGSSRRSSKSNRSSRSGLEMGIAMDSVDRTKGHDKPRIVRPRSTPQSIEGYQHEKKSQLIRAKSVDKWTSAEVMSEQKDMEAQLAVLAMEHSKKSTRTPSSNASPQIEER